ncbi:MAG: hypothetical protein ACO331_00095 [Prochlorothrix sp.]
MANPTHNPIFTALAHELGELALYQALYHMISDRELTLSIVTSA